jgi:hypothetical protein
MTGPTAQLVALACHVNARTKNLAAPSFFPNNSTCQFCEFIHFIRRPRTWLGRIRGWDIVADSPESWFASEDVQGREAFVLHGPSRDPRFSDRMTAVFVGGGGRWLLALRDALSDGGRALLWEAGWEVGDRKSPDRRLWRVRYALIGEDPAFSLPQGRTLDATVDSLRLALADVRTFAQEHNLEWAKEFASAEQCLDSDDPRSLVYHKDLSPPGLLSLAAERVLACCQRAWVFGGMGSWNDLAFAGAEQERYDRVSDQLFRVVNDAICAAANSAAPAT